MTNHQTYIAFALQLAQQGRYTVSPNPMVGCVIVKNDQIIAQAYHQRAGEAHAEILALAQTGSEATDASVYVTLEPCCHQGKTPPCTLALIQAGIKKVYIACMDPNPLVAGKGIKALSAAGIEVKVGLCADEAKQLNKIFFHYIQYKKPYVIAKWAMSLDGKTTTHPQDSRQISSHTLQKTSHLLRQEMDAILIGAKTAIHDNPLLTVRNVHHDKQPLRIILTRKTSLPLHLKLLDAAMPAKTIVATTEINAHHYHELKNQGIEILILHRNHHDEIDLQHLLQELGKREITSLLVEGGMTTHEIFMRENLVNQFHVYLAPVIIGSQTQKQKVYPIHFSQIETDFHIIANSGEHYV